VSLLLKKKITGFLDVTKKNRKHEVSAAPQPAAPTSALKRLAPDRQDNLCQGCSMLLIRVKYCSII
jgi:hypothetical protein